MRSLSRISCAAVLALSALAACSKKDSRVDDALNNDLSLAAQQRPGQLDSVSAIEQGYASRAYAPAAPAARTYSAPARRTTTRRSTSSSSSSGTYSGSSAGEVSSAPAPQRTTTVKHTQRDAAIGAAAGAIIGATTSKDKVKGGIIGAAAGGILGGVIGNNVDKKTKKVP
jgi:Glycine zipper